MEDGTRRSVDDLAKALECILDSVIEETGLSTTSKKKKHNLTANQLKTVQSLHKFVSSSSFQQNTGSTSAISGTIACCDGFISEWENAGGKSAAVQQLVALLQKASYQSASLVNRRHFYRSFRSRTSPMKIVRIVRRDDPLGATIKCDGGKVYIARIIAGGVADRSACIQEGDRVLEVNNVSVADKTADEIVALLNRCDGGCVTFKLIPAEISNPQNNQPDQSHIHLRALYDYDGSKDTRHPCPEAALAFRKGDILELLVCNDEHWWQARCLGSGALAHGEDRILSAAHAGNGVGLLRVGLIPSELLQQKTKQAEEKKTPSKNCSEDDLYYESVCRWTNRTNLVRPIVLIGPPGVGRNELKRRLLMLFPERFSTTVPHTTRPPRPGEVEGVDYYFVERGEMEEMIEEDQMLEFGEFRGNLYGTALSAVRKAREKATPLLTPHPLALRHLRTAEFSPILIFVQPPSFEVFKESREAFRARMARGSTASPGPTSRGFTDAEVRQVLTNAANLEHAYGHMFDARLVNANLEDSMSNLIKLLHSLESKPTWVPLSWATKCVD
ncbi:unnamed protein product [Caenorhabditis auriculariae]|uniref:Uncharacterized protein n=1 Tax=Caenorhabditis auriculariae TaxID=2777116 RepID=A0A8S1HSA0_9PELO|nr:unnamed protein product [Caenorhabditis auriculariae]